jgi:hypothetical protein
MHDVVVSLLPDDIYEAGKRLVRVETLGRQAATKSSNP